MTAHKASSSSSSKSKLWNHHVFLSFRGVDTRNVFTGHLHEAFKDRGYKAYMDEDDLKIGEEITKELLRAIEESKVYIIVFSKGYADSSWCLNELVKIMECGSKLKRHVLPIFYHVDPSHVRHQDEDLAKAFKKHEEGIGEEKDDEKREAKQERVKQWREALTKAANLAGHHIQNTDNRGDAKHIREIVNKVIKEWFLSVNTLHVAKYQVGIDSRIQGIINDLLSGGSDGVLMVGIWGMGGVGKTTVATAIYNQIQHMFEFKSFLADVSNTAREHGLVYLLKKLIFDILKEKSKISSVAEGIGQIEQEFQHRRVLIIMDNIVGKEQLNALAQKHDWFGPGSRIIITTQDEHLLKQVKVDKIYLAKKMNEEEALELFSWHAFKNSYPNHGYLELSKNCVSYCGGLPLALEVLGSLLIGRKVEEWKIELEKLKEIPDEGIIKPLRVSFDDLDSTQKDIFLDISCFFIGKNKDYVAKILNACGFFATIGINILCERCLVTVERNKLFVHDLLREMAKVIISEKSPGDLGKWSRLWNNEEVTNVLTNKSGTEEVGGLALDFPDPWFPSSEETEITSFGIEAFANMKKLRLLHLNNVQLNGEYKHLPKELIWLCWRRFPLASIPNDFLNQPRLVVLDMQRSRLVKVWKGSKSLQQLKIINLSWSTSLIKSPNVSELPNLEELILDYCARLSMIHPSTGHCERLSLVNLSYCRCLKSLGDFCKSKSVETLYLNGCSGLEQPLKDLGEVVSLRILEYANIPITQVPYLGSLTSLQDLTLNRSNFHTLPSLNGLSKLESLRLSHCRFLHKILDLPTKLKFLYAFHCPALEKMPDFSEMSNMRELNLSDSHKLTEVLGLDKSLNSMTLIDMQSCIDLTTDFMKNILQGWTSCGFGGVVLHGDYVPDWFQFVNDGNKVSFDIPLSDDRNFEGLALYCVYGECDINSGHLPLAITVINNTKRTELWACINLEIFDVDIEIILPEGLWQGQLSNDKLNLQGGDKVEVEIVFAEPNYPRSVKRTGVNLVWDKPLRENVHDLDKVGYVMSHIQPGSMVRHNQSGDASSSSHM